MILALIICLFIAAILGLFLKNANDSLKYKLQMVASTELAIEAYSFLDAGLAFLLDYSAKSDVPTGASNTTAQRAQKPAGQMIFDKKILGTKDVIDNEMISQYLNFHIYQKLKEVQNTLKYDSTSTPRISFSKSGQDFTVNYDFEDLSNKIPLTKSFLENLNLQKQGQGQLETFREKLHSALNNNSQNLFTSWAHVLKALENSDIRNVPLQTLQQYFTVDPFILDNAEDTNSTTKAFVKVNLLTAAKEIRNAVGFGSSELTYSNIDNFISGKPQLGQKFCADVRYFRLIVAITHDNHIFKLVCTCKTQNHPSNSTTDPTFGSRFSPFEIIGIEEI